MACRVGSAQPFDATMQASRSLSPQVLQNVPAGVGQVDEADTTVTRVRDGFDRAELGQVRHHARGNRGADDLVAGEITQADRVGLFDPELGRRA
jgi:hypothetical protein